MAEEMAMFVDFENLRYGMVLGLLEKAMREETTGLESKRIQERNRLQRRLTEVQHRIDQAYTDKVDGKIPEDFWARKSQEWRVQEQEALLALKALDEAEPGRIMDGVRILELANKAYFLYLKQDPTEKAKLLRIVLSNCLLDSASVYPTYRKPFDLILGAAKTGEWYARGDSNTRPLAS